MVPSPGPPEPAAKAPSGHRLVPHPSELRIEAWGPDLASAIVETLKALVESFAEIPPDTEASSVAPLCVGPSPPEEALVLVLEEVIYHLDVHGLVPVRFQLAEHADGGLAGQMDLVPLDRVEVVGPAPKAVSYHDLSVSDVGDQVRCEVLVDV